MAAIAPVPFAEWLRAELNVRGWGIRTLAAKIDPSNPEVPRRALHHYMRGSLPTERYAAAIAAAFEIAREDVPVEEAASVASPFRDGSRSHAPAADRAGRVASDGASLSEDAA